MREVEEGAFRADYVGPFPAPICQAEFLARITATTTVKDARGGGKRVSCS
jgi:hypothetical protein